KQEGNQVIQGWAINKSGIDVVNVYIDNKFIGKANYGEDSPFVAQDYPGYPNNNKAGYTLRFDASKLSLGNHEIKAEAVGKDGTKHEKLAEVKVVEGKSPKTHINTNLKELKQEGNQVIQGWAINKSGVEAVNVYIDNKFIGKANYGEDSPFVAQDYPGYPNNNKAGYTLRFDASKLSLGNHEIKAEAVGKDGTKHEKLAKVKVVEGKLPKTHINTNLKELKQTTNQIIQGWAINKSGVEAVKIYIDNKFVGQAIYGEDSPFVAQDYPGYPNNNKAGYTLRFDASKLSLGNHEVKAVAIGKDGSKHEKIANIKVVKFLPPLTHINSHIVEIDRTKPVTIQGWALNESGIASVNVYIDNNFIGKAITGEYSPFVQMDYPRYPENDKAGYTLKTSLTNLTLGKHTLKVEAVGKNGSKHISEINVKVVAPLIVIDPGHNQGGDQGHISHIGGITYNETDLNMDVSVKLQGDLMRMGYDIVMTRQPWEISYEEEKISLRRRVNLANSLNADLFVSIHHNAFNESSAHGTEVWYTSNKTDTANSNASTEGKYLANKIAPVIAKSGNYYDRGSKQGNLYVTKYTNMPSVLVECGFLTNSNDAKKAADPNTQVKVARGIANTLNDWFKK
ncbi:N-acetylmuramoyl-L-alanine amidase, partial [Clostridium tarantellae]